MSKKLLFNNKKAVETTVAEYVVDTGYEYIGGQSLEVE